MSPAPVFSPARWAAGFLLLALSLLALGAHAQAVAVVTDVKGAVAFAPDRGTKPVALLSELTNGADIQLEKGATLSLVYLQSGTEFQLRGPARITLGATAPQSVAGASAILRSSVVAAETARLVIAETWDAGWRATIDGRPLAVEAVDDLWLGVRPGCCCPLPCKAASWCWMTSWRCRPG